MAIPTVARVGLMLLFREGMGKRAEQKEQEQMREFAQYRANELQRPVVTVGDDGFDPETFCDHCRSIKDNSSVVLVCYGLERVPDIESAWEQITRVAGSPSNIFVAYHKGGIVSALHPKVKWKIESAPPLSPTLAYRGKRTTGGFVFIKPYEE